MSYKDKAVAEYHGGALTIHDKPPARRYPCFATGCPMPGTIFPGQLLGDKTGDGTCAWHYSVKSTDMPKVTKVLQDWACVSYEINESRRVLTGENVSDPAFVQRAFDAAWERLSASVDAGWREQLEPGNIRSRDGTEQPYRENYGDWSKRLHEFLGARVVEVLSVNQRRTA